MPIGPTTDSSHGKRRRWVLDVFVHKFPRHVELVTGFERRFWPRPMEFHRFFVPAVVVVVLGEDLYIIEIFVGCERDLLWKMEDFTFLSWQVLGANRSRSRSFLIHSA